jgi:hypothetical protein
MIDVSPELLAFLREEYGRCKDDTLDDDRTVAIDRYNGEPYGDEEEGRSQVVARDTAETTDYMVISIMRTLVSGDRVVEFVHRDSEAAHIATETIMHLFMDDQDGYSITHDWLKAGLLEKNAIAMTYGEPQPPKRRQMQGVSAMALMAAEQQGIKVIEAEETGEEGEEGPIFNVTIIEERPTKFCDAAVPNEEFYCSPDARTITEAPLKGRKVKKSLSDLVEMGYDLDELKTVGMIDDSTLDDARDQDRNQWNGERTGPNRIIWWHEEYARFDANGDGIAELLYIQRTSDYKVFAIEEMEDPDDHPFEDWCPFPMQHRRIGQSLADKVMDIERINTVLLRQSLDGIYFSNNSGHYVHEDSINENTVEDLLTVRQGRLVRWKGANKPEREQGYFNAADGFQMLEYMGGVKENRTGITRLNQGLDADTLNKTASGQAQLQALGQQVEEYVARNFANAFARLFTKKARLLRRYGKPIMVPIDGEYVEVDPTQWPEDMIARPRVGLGSGRKDQRMQNRLTLGEIQKACIEGGLRIVGEKQVYNLSKGLVSDMGLGEVSEYFVDPDDLGPAEPQPDPEMAKAQADMQAKQAELQMKQQAQQADMALRQQEGALKLQLTREEAAAKLELEQAKAEQEARLAEQKFQFEASLAQRKMELEADLARENAARQHEVAMKTADAKISQNRAGGDLSK